MSLMEPELLHRLGVETGAFVAGVVGTVANDLCRWQAKASGRAATIRRLESRIAELESEAADLRRDREAWEWLASRPHLDVVCVIGTPPGERRYRVLDFTVTLDAKNLGEGPTPREAVLAAMEAEKGRGGDG